MALILGVDEAGRGPIIGPLVLAAAAIKNKNLHKLESLKNIKDSKLLTKKQREESYKNIMRVIDAYKVLIIYPSEIDNAIDGENLLNLNWLEANKTAEMINELNPGEAFVDCPSPNISKYQSYLFRLLKNKKIKLVCSHKAESLFKVVAAASIIAKVTRDKEIEKIQKEIPENIGSGYIADPITKKFIEENYKLYPDIIRKSWLPYKNLLKKQFQKSLGEFNDK